ncbi:MAG: EF-hand domain-containing protein [Polaromonas sp.]|uniref:EF-hand domain-containing protein n=1 Tax=Polaromonas sp. TaxID=1869339 RepID=UPI002733A5F4|nr:EF-hand domain-containing protein [Polaromonas sp.]MDP3798851.1 EF-hand domain-containing protein [Polaromonas sp.]
MMLTLTAAGALLAMRAQAQTPEPAAAAPAQTAPSPVAAPKYAAKDMVRAFSYMDANRDGKVSREEAAGFRGVARHFDEADTDRDGFLSSEEFESALNGRKPQ